MMIFMEKYVRVTPPVYYVAAINGCGIFFKKVEFYDSKSFSFFPEIEQLRSVIDRNIIAASIEYQNKYMNPGPR